MRSLGLVFAVLTLVGCGASRSNGPAATTVTGADVPSQAPAAREASSSSTSSSTPAPEGQLVCRAKNKLDGTATELYLTWKGASASGTLRHVAPSGYTEDRPVRAERHKSAIIVDEPNAEDLVDHAAVVGNSNGKRVMRVTGGTTDACE